jgi:PAS domain S-box-containing protein
MGLRIRIPNQFFAKSIKTQLMVPLFMLTTAAIALTAFLGVRGVITSGSKTQQITASAAQQRAQEFLGQTATATAAKNSLIFENIQLESNNLAGIASNILNNPAQYGQSGWRFDAHVTRLPSGIYTNSPDEPASVYVSAKTPLTPQMKQESEQAVYLDHIFPLTLQNESNAVAVYFVGKAGEVRYYPNIGLANVLPPDYTPLEDFYYTLASPANNPDKTLKWTDVYDDPAGNGLMITATNPVYTKSGFTGVVGMDVTLNHVAANVASYAPIKGSYAFLIDRQERAVALPEQGYHDMLGRAPKKGEFGADLKNVKGGFSAVLGNMRQGKSEFATVRAGNSDLYVASAPVQGTTFSLGIVAKQSVVLQVVGDLRTQVTHSVRGVLYTQILPAAMLVLGLVGVLSFLYIRYITKPIIALTDETHHIMQGQFGHRVSVTSSNEVGQLAAAFNKMSAELAAYYQVLEDKVRDRTRALNQKVRELSNAKAKDEAMLSSIGDGVIVTDAHGNVLVVNDTAATLLGLNKKEIIGRPFTSYHLYDDKGVSIPPKKRPEHQSLEANKKVSLDAKATLAHGALDLHLTATPVMQGDKLIGAIQIIRDVTKEKEVDRMKTEFISIASHQLRTPLSAIKWFGEMLLNGDSGKLKPGQAELAQSIYNSTERMMDLVNSLLNIARIESGRIMIEPKPTDLNELIAGIVNDLKAKTEDRKQTLVVSVHKDLPKINLDARMIGQVYLNLLTNAIKYTPKGGEITVMVSRKGNELLSQVTDNGYGIPKAEQGKLFQKFFRATNITKVESDGTGLGMYLVKAIIESSGGKIWFKSELDKGTTFWFTLPLSGMKPKEGEVTLNA